MSEYHFVGIGGIGMSGLAQVLRARGHGVSGSDRYRDMGMREELFAKLIRQGMTVVPQDGSGVREDTDFVIASSAIEEDNPDLAAARRRAKPVVLRADLLAELFHEKPGIAVAGSFGKTTIAGLLSWILCQAGRDPLAIVGGIMRSFEDEDWIGNALPGSGMACIETDESDGSVAAYHARIGVITGVTRDHKEHGELMDLFRTFAEQTEQTLVLGAESADLAELTSSLSRGRGAGVITYGLSGSADLRADDVTNEGFGSRFRLGKREFRLPLCGRHNVENALAAIAAARAAGVDDDAIAAAIQSFRGMARRLEVIGEARGVRVIDDYAHNPAKVAAAIQAVRPLSRRLIAVFQPHGFGPARFMREALTDLFAREAPCLRRSAAGTRNGSIMFLLPIYYVGGTTQKDISSEDLARDAAEQGGDVRPVSREQLIAAVREEAHEGDTVLVMGARDDSLTDLCRDIVAALG